MSRHTSVRRRFATACAIAACAVVAYAQVASPARQASVYVTNAGAALVAQGLAQAAPEGSAAAAFQAVPAPTLRNVPNDGYAQVTMAPWIESNGWRFQRGLDHASYPKLPRGVAPLAAAEAFAFNVDAILDPDPADVQELGGVLSFLKSHRQPARPPLANIGVIDDGSPAMGEVLNMLTRRNLLYRLVTPADKPLDLTVQLGTPAFPVTAVSNPSDFAARVRERLGDDKRLVRLFGTNTAMARLTGDSQHARLVLVNYSRNRTQQDLRVRVLGRYRPVMLAAYGAPAGAEVGDVRHPDQATEFGIATFNTIAIVDLDAER